MAARLYGCTEPQIFTKPLRELTPETSNGFSCIAFAENVLDIKLLPWQKWFLIHLLELLPDGSYRFRQAIVEVARQNGKTMVAVVLILWRMYIDGSTLVLGTAQNLETSESTWQDTLDVIEAIEDLAGEVVSVSRQSGKRSIRLVSGAEYKVAPASRKGARGKASDTVVLDELREHHDWEAWGAAANTAMAQPRGLILGISNAGDARSVVLKEMRAKGIAAVDDPDTTLAYYGWTVPDDDPIDQPESWVKANPAYGYTINHAAMANAMNQREAKFRTENLCQWVQEVRRPFLDQRAWGECGDPRAAIASGSDLCVGIDTSADRAYCSVGVAGFDDQGVPVVEVIAHRAGMLWVTNWVKGLVGRHPVREVLIQARGCPASELAPVLANANIPVRLVQGTMLGAGTGQLSDHIKARSFKHRNQPLLNVAVAGAFTRRMGDQVAWDRQESSAVDISSLVAVSWALYGLMNDESGDPQLSAYRDMTAWWVTPSSQLMQEVVEDELISSGDWWE